MKKAPPKQSQNLLAASPQKLISWRTLRQEQGCGPRTSWDGGKVVAGVCVEISTRRDFLCD
jgi:hypothetical protein